MYILTLIICVWTAIHMHIDQSTQVGGDIFCSSWRFRCFVVYLAEAETNPLFFAFYLMFCICPVVWGFVSVFIVLEAFISVRSLPIGSYDTVTWAYF